MSSISWMKVTCRLGLQIAAISLLALLGACGSHPVYEDESFSKESPFRKNFVQSEQRVCASAQLVLLGQGYRIEKTEEVSIHAKKDFQPEDEVNVVIDFEVICKAAANGLGSIVFANAVQTTYKLRKTSAASSLSVAGAGSIAMPWGKTTDSLVKVGGETIADKEFYQRFFDLLTSTLGQ